MMKPWQHLCDQKGEECLLKYLSVNLIKDVKDLQSVKSLSHVQLFVTPWTVACQAPLSMEFSRQEYWSGLPFPTPIYARH